MVKSIKNDAKISELLSNNEIDELFDLNKILININKIFERLGLNEKSN